MNSNDIIEITLSDYFKNMNFKDYSLYFQKFVDSTLANIEIELDNYLSEDQSSFFGTFGYQYLRQGSKYNNTEEIIFVGNMVEKSLFDFAIMDEEIKDNYQSNISEAFDLFSENFKKQFKLNRGKRTNIIFYQTDYELEGTIFRDGIKLDFYMEKVKDFLRPYTVNDTIYMGKL